MKTTPLTMTTKGIRVWVQGIAQHGWPAGTTYNTVIVGDTITYTKATEGKLRKVTAGKGCLIDNTSNKVTRWAQGSTQATYTITPHTITITRIA
jgi:hypothetical protein